MTKFKIVPVEADEAMVTSGIANNGTGPFLSRAVYDHMLAAAPATPDELVERVARHVYAAMPFDGASHLIKPTWVEGGNSHRQAEARDAARAIITEINRGADDG